MSSDYFKTHTLISKVNIAGNGVGFFETIMMESFGTFQQGQKGEDVI